MSRPTLEWPTSPAHPSTDFGSTTGHTAHGSLARCSTPSSPAALRLLAVIVIGACDAAIRLSPTTHAVTGTPPLSGDRMLPLAGRAQGNRSRLVVVIVLSLSSFMVGCTVGFLFTS
jgi:hypothetical protein